MKFLIFVLLSVFISALDAHANDSLKASQVINHLRTVGYNGQGFEKLPNKLRFDGWSFEKISDKYYNVRSPKGLSQRTYEYEYFMDSHSLLKVTMVGDVKAISLYKKAACIEIYKASLEIKAEESLQETLQEIVLKYKIKDPSEDTKDDKWYARNYAKHCKDIFALDQDEAIKKILKEKSTSK